jgi:hypothetical protein
MRLFTLLIACALSCGALSATELSGQYVEARTCDVWVGACFANAEMNLTGRHAMLAWKIEKGTQDGVRLDGLSVVAVVEASNTLGLKQTGAAKAVVIVDQNATSEQRVALVAAAHRLGGELLRNVELVHSAPISISTCECKDNACAKVEAGTAKIQTRCIHATEDSVCGHEDNFYPPLSAGIAGKSAMVTEHSYVGKGFNKTWHDALRRGAYVGTFSVK